jgi:hypothetical protein
MKAKRHTAPQHDLPGEPGQAFNLATQPTNDGWRDASDRDEAEADRLSAGARQGDMFPDAEGFAPGAHGPGF